MTDYRQKKIAVINDLTGYGKCALTISIPLISSLGLACCPVPTSIFSNHTGYPAFQCKDLTDNLAAYIEQWEKLHFSFDGILSGYLGSESQMQLVADFICRFKTASTLVVLDPVMADHGKLYSAYTPGMCLKMKSLLPLADVLTPNVTEACILTDTPYKENWEKAALIELAEKLSSFGPRQIVITGIEEEHFITNLCYEKGKNVELVQSPKLGTGHHGTGDIFSSLLTSFMVKNTDLTSSVTKAADFIQKCLAHTLEFRVTEPEGILFEDMLYLLQQ